jgi:large subunit ribosomal protein L24
VRQFLTFVAVLLVVALTAALVAPLFIDWSRHRGQIEAELSAVVGAPVVVAGPIDIRFLPTPYLLLKDVTIAAAPGGPAALVCKSLQLEASLASLPSGKARFTLARVDHPILTLVRRPDGGVDLPSWRLQVAGGRVALDRLVVEAGRVILTGGGQKPLGVDLDLDASAASLVGPFRGSGRVAAPGLGAAAINFASGAMTDGALPLKLEATGDGGPSLIFDGAVTMSPRAGGGGAVA